MQAGTQRGDPASQAQRSLTSLQAQAAPKRDGQSWHRGAAASHPAAAQQGDPAAPQAAPSLAELSSPLNRAVSLLPGFTGWDARSSTDLHLDLLSPLSEIPPRIRGSASRQGPQRTLQESIPTHILSLQLLSFT